jgi:hypothetical protein
MKFIITIFAISILSTSCVSEESIETSDEILNTKEQLLSEGHWICTQQCANGTTLAGYGNSASEAYQDLSGCGSGGGNINCNFAEPIITESQVITEDETSVITEDVD